VYPSQQMFWNAMLRKGLNLISYDCKKIKIWTVFFYFFYPILMFIFMGYWWCIHINSNRVQNSDFFFSCIFFSLKLILLRASCIMSTNFLCLLQFLR
jgi:hypothetical protein